VDVKITRPLAFIDLETTGVDLSRDRIIEISILKLFPEGNTEVKTRRFNPGIPIPEASTKIHGITDADVADEPLFAQLAKSIANFISDCDLAGYNSIRFDIPMLMEEFLRSKVDFTIKNRKMIDMQVIFHQMEPRNLSAAYRFYCNKELTHAHSAEADILATFEVLKAQMSKYKGMQIPSGDAEKKLMFPEGMDALHEFCNITRFADLAGRVVYDEKGKEIFNFGKHKGKTVEGVFEQEPSYYTWMMNGDFPQYTKNVITEIYLRKMQSKS